MSILAGGVTLSPATLRSLLTLGGDTAATIENGAENNPAVRGGHLLVKYAAPLNKYYEQWHGRELHALNTFVQQQSTPDLYDTHTADTTNVRDTVHVNAWANVHTQLQTVRRSVGLPNGLPDSSQFVQDARVGALVAAHTASSEFVRDKFFVDYDDRRSLRTKIINVYAATGQTSVDTIGSAMDMAGSLVQVKDANRQYIQQLARFDADKAAYQAEQAAKRRSAQGSMFSKVLGVAVSAVTGGLG